MFADLRTRLRALFRRDAVEVELDDELRFHFEKQVQKYVTSGLPRAEAMRRARLEFGGTDAVKEECREARGVHFLEIAAQDIRYSLRLLGKNWKLAAIATLSLAVAMALSVLGLSVANGVLLRPPYAADPQQLVTIYTSTPAAEFEDVSYPDYKYYRDHNRSFSGLAAAPNGVSKIRLVHRGRDEMGTSEQVSDNYFAVMGIRPFLGRVFAPGDDDKRASEVVLTYSCWKRWGADPRIVGETVMLGHEPFTIAGVAPKDFTGIVFGFNVDVIVNMGMGAASAEELQNFNDGNNRWLFLVGRLSPGVSAKHATADLRALSAQLASDYPAADKDRVALLTSTTVLPPDARSTGKLISGVLVAVVLMVLLIACANVANLLLGLATGRKQEILIRSALGATRGRLIRQLLTESLILCTMGGAVGFLLAAVVLARFSHFSTSLPVFGGFDFATNFQVNGTVAAMTLAIILAASVATGLAPALYSSEPNVAGALSGEAVVGGTRKNLARNALVVVQIAVCTLVIAGVGVFLRSLHNLREVNTGLSSRRLVAALVNFQADGFRQAEAEKLYQRLDQGTAQLYGVESHTLAVDFPLMDSAWPASEIAILNANDAAHQHEQIPGTVVDGNYFQTLGIPLIAGHTFTAADTKERPEVIVINRTMAQTYWPGDDSSQDAVGKTVHLKDDDRDATVVGVVADSKYNTLDEVAHPVIYYALSQHYQPGLALIVRTNGDPRLWKQPLEEMVRGLHLHVDVPPFTLDDVMHFTLLIPLLTLSVVVAAGMLALLLAILGLYGAIFYSVNERRREIGIRVALGASPAHLIEMFLRQTAMVAGVGVSVGLILGIVATSVFQSQFFQISTVELHVLIPVAAAMMLLALGICYAAGRPWIRVSPLDAVRHN
jgi:putative ABC transport system permease protein